MQDCLDAILVLEAVTKPEREAVRESMRQSLRGPPDGGSLGEEGEQEEESVGMGSVFVETGTMSEAEVTAVAKKMFHWYDLDQSGVVL